MVEEGVCNAVVLGDVVNAAVDVCVLDTDVVCVGVGVIVEVNELLGVIVAVTELLGVLLAVVRSVYDHDRA